VVRAKVKSKRASRPLPDMTFTHDISGLGVHVGAEDGVDAGLVAALLAEPAEEVGVEAHGHDGLGGGHYDGGGFPECGVGGVSVGVGGDALADLGVGEAAQLVPVGSGAVFSSALFPGALNPRGFAGSRGARAARSATLNSFSRHR